MGLSLWSASATASTRRCPIPSQAPAPSSAPLLRRRSPGSSTATIPGGGVGQRPWTWLGSWNSSLFSSSSSTSSLLYPPKKLSQQTLSRILLYILLSIFILYAVIVLYIARSTTASSSSSSPGIGGVVQQTSGKQSTKTISSSSGGSGAGLLQVKLRTKQELVARHDESDEQSIHHPDKIIIPAAEHHGRAHQESIEEDLQRLQQQQALLPLEHIHQEEHHDPHHTIPPPAEADASTERSYILKAFLEKVDQDSWNIKPLPIRTSTTATADQLIEVSFPQVNSCSRLPDQLPTSEATADTNVAEAAGVSPTNADPFLPWIHDVFPTHDGRFIQIVAQNKRRCKCGTTEQEIQFRKFHQPQVSLFQHVPIQRIIVHNDNSTSGGAPAASETRYRLASHEEADDDGMETRFICRFKPSMQETLSRFNFHYEYATWRKSGSKARSSFTPDGQTDRKALHTSQLIFTCPVPSNLIPMIQSGDSVQNDWATLFLDIIPIRTPPRYGISNAFFPPRYHAHQTSNMSAAFDTNVEWGKNHILPRIVDSGRWENIPICKPSHLTYAESFQVSSSSERNARVNEAETALEASTTTRLPHHRLIACTWASSEYTTRGDRFAVTDGRRRLQEWLAYNLMIGFNHIYVYDNSPPAGSLGGDSGAAASTLQDVTDLFPSHQVTRIAWPAKICNNHRNFDDSPGERSSQYAAESSCRLRFGPYADWIGGFDMDEYANPLGNYTSLYPILDQLDQQGTKILSLKSWRAWPRRDLIETPVPIHNETICEEPFPCFHLKVRPNLTILQTYNCDRQKGNKKEAMPAEKQLFRSDYVLQHFIHFSTVTVLTQMNQEETLRAGFHWRQRIHVDPRHRFSDELQEASMLHAKAMATPDTAGWLRRCTGKQKHGTCRIGVPWPPGAEQAGETTDSQGWFYNCYVNEKIENYWVPKLDDALKQLHIKQ